MAEVAPDHSASKRTVDLDDLFQILIARNVPAFVAKKEITGALQLGKLRIDLHIAAGARKTRPMRQATSEELKAEQAGKGLEFLYEASPAGGITVAVHPQSWDAPGVLALAIVGSHLVVEPQCSLDFPWQAYSFSISNPVVIDELWPRAASGPMSASPDEAADNPRPPEGTSKIALIVWAYGELLPTNELTGLRGKELRRKVYLKIGQNFTAGPRTFEEAMQRYREEHAI
jgi:hypothetical protein